MSATTYDVAVIGAGANGLVAATALARAGMRTVLLERSDAVGGQGQLVEFAPGFRAAPLGLDSGWVPPAVADVIGAAGLERDSADAPLSVPVEPGRFLSLSRDASRAAEAIRPFSTTDAAAWPVFTTKLRTLAGFLEVLYQTPAPDIDARSLGEVLPLLGVGGKFRALGRADMIGFLRTLPMSVWELLDDAFAFGPLKAAVATGGIQDFQQGPRSGGTGFVLLHHLVGAPAGSVRGRLPWRGGPAAFSEAAYAAARRASVNVRTGAAVQRIQVRDDAVRGVVLENGEEIGAAAVLSTADPARTLLDWVDPVWLDPEFLHAVGNIRYRGCTAFVLYGLETLPEFPGLSSDALGGTVTLTASIPALERAADAAKYGTVAERPHVELTVPTLGRSGMAPDGRHVVIARVQYAPYRLANREAWITQGRDALADTVTSAIAAVSPGFASRIAHRVTWTPCAIEERFGIREGAATHGELGLDQILFMRPVAGFSRYAMPVSGLYLGGAGAHPGPGVLGGPGLLAARQLIADRKHGRNAS